MFKHYDLLQRQYDLESQGMRNKEKQTEWKIRIKNMYISAQQGKF